MNVAVGSTWTIRDASAVDREWASVVVTGHYAGEPVIRPLNGVECVAVTPESLMAAYEQASAGTSAHDRLITAGGTALAAWGSE
jgi:hypothetical protein